MPPFTHVFGPAVYTGYGTANARMHQRFSITAELLAQFRELRFFDKISTPLCRTFSRFKPPDIVHFRIIQFLWIARILKMSGQV